MRLENSFDINNIESPVLKKMLKYRNIIIVAFISLLLVFSAFFQVEPEEVGVITRFGKYVRKVEPGLNMKMPFIEQVYKVPVERQQKLEFGFRTVKAGVNTQYTRSGAKDESLMFDGIIHPSILQILLAIAYPLGFIFVVIGKSELFTEHTTLAVIPVLNKNATIKSLLILWGIVYAGNLLGGYFFEYILSVLPERLNAIDNGAFYGLAKN